MKLLFIILICLSWCVIVYLFRRVAEQDRVLWRMHEDVLDSDEFQLVQSLARLESAIATVGGLSQALQEDDGEGADGK